MSFRLLKSPLVVIREVLKQFELKDLFMLSLCSQNTKILVKSLRNKSLNLEFSVDCMSWNPQVLLKTKEMRQSMQIVVLQHATDSYKSVPKSIENLKIDGYTVPVLWRFGCFHSNWQDRLIGLKVIISLTRKLFGIDVHEFLFRENYICLLDYINQIQQDPPTFGLITGHKDLSVPPNSEQCRHILERCRLKTLNFEADFPDDFIFNAKFQDYEHLVLEVGHWVTVDNLQALSNSCVQLEINNSKLTNENFYQFLQYWINDTMNRLECLSIETESVDFDIVFGDLTKVLVDEPKQFIRKSGKKLELPGDHHDIQREDGTRASICYIREKKTFCFAVWPNL